MFNPNYTYDNSQEAATLWYHDHALGITRLNTYAGLAGFYLLRDKNEDVLVANRNLPTGPYEIGLAIQDRQFLTDGSLWFPSTPPNPGQPDPSVLPEFFGDHILVNGMAWPVLDVEPRQYRFRILNGSDSRFYELRLQPAGIVPGPVYYPFVQIGTDDGLLNSPVKVDPLILGPGERADVVLDFTQLAGRKIIVRNFGVTPYGNAMGTPPDPLTTGQVMAFRVVKPLDPAWPVTTLPNNLRPVWGPIPSPGPSSAIRRLLLWESTDGYGRIMPMLGTAAQGGLMWGDPVTEQPSFNTTETWEVYNTTADAHPIHLHLVAFQIIDRQAFTATQDPVTGALTNIAFPTPARPPASNEKGFKDTAQMYPGEVTRVVAKFDRRGEYVWHCHILSHEDNEMMRPYVVV